MACSTPLDFGFVCHQGRKPGGCAVNQDEGVVRKLDKGHSVYGVFDGHGPKGHLVSAFVKDTLPDMVLTQGRCVANMEKACVDAFLQLQLVLSASAQRKTVGSKLSGTTATLVMHDRDNAKLTLAHVGDSSAVLGKYQSDRLGLQAVQLTRDHKADLACEKEKIEQGGGCVLQDEHGTYRVYVPDQAYPALNMTRGLGGCQWHQMCGISAEPETSEIDLSSDDRVLLICSDGVWDFLSPQEAMDVIAMFEASDVQAAAERLVAEAEDRWFAETGGLHADDITVVVAHLHTSLDAVLEEEEGEAA